MWQPDIHDRIIAAKTFPNGIVILILVAIGMTDGRVIVANLSILARIASMTRRKIIPWTQMTFPLRAPNPELWVGP